MSQNKLINWLSYIIEMPIESVRRSPSDALHVSIKKGRLMLSTDLTIYSWDDKYMNYVWGFQKLNWQKIHLKKGLLLGMGLGAVPYILESRFDTSIPFTAIEIDPDVVRLAKKYSLIRLKTVPQVICSDASSAVFGLKDSYDLIVIDICKEDFIPEAFESEAFIRQIKELLTDGGIVMYNRFYSTFKDHFRTDRYFKNVFLKVFPQGYLLDQNGTCLLCNQKNLLQP